MKTIRTKCEMEAIIKCDPPFSNIGEVTEYLEIKMKSGESFIFEIEFIIDDLFTTVISDIARINNYKFSLNKSKRILEFKKKRV